MAKKTPAVEDVQTAVSPEVVGEVTTPPATEAPGMSFPPTIESLKGTAMEAVIKNWATQEKREQITICKEEGCYYPLNPVMDARANAPKKMTGKKGPAIAGLCSWDPNHCGGEQPMYPPTPKEDL